uniref:Uncharacterized protein n=1 Tax=Amphimedon queenslandica TaxID=400682 RepID=A0A1X7V368_AMPQE
TYNGRMAPVVECLITHRGCTRLSFWKVPRRAIYAITKHETKLDSDDDDKLVIEKPQKKGVVCIEDKID